MRDNAATADVPLPAFFPCSPLRAVPFVLARSSRRSRVVILDPVNVRARPLCSAAKDYIARIRSGVVNMVCYGNGNPGNASNSEGGLPQVRHCPGWTALGCPATNGGSQGLGNRLGAVLSGGDVRCYSCRTYRVCEGPSGQRCHTYITDPQAAHCTTCLSGHAVTQVRGSANPSSLRAELCAGHVARTVQWLGPALDGTAASRPVHRVTLCMIITGSIPSS